jgi:ABC-type branched-subunit amino acid transport system substrate-binding protein
MSAQVKILRQTGADAIIAVGVYGPCGAFIRDARMAGWSVPVANVSFVGAAEMLARLGGYSQKLGRDLITKLLNSQVVPSQEDVRLPLVADFRAHIRTQHHGGPAIRPASCSPSRC